MIKTNPFYCLIALVLCLPALSLADYEDGVNAALAGDFATAYREFSLAAEAGLPLAQYNLAILYFTGQGVERDMAQAFEWTLRAAEQGHVEAQANLGSLYLNGDGTEADAEAGVRWLSSAARSDHAGAAYSLANMYFNGLSVDPSLVQAHAWASQALQAARDIDDPQTAMEAQDLRSRIEEGLDDDELGQARRLYARWQIE